MKLRLRLYHDVEGEFLASEPDGWVKSIVGFERHPTLHCLVMFYRTTFQAYGSNGVDDGGREFLLKVEENHGVNAVILAELQRADDNIVFRAISSLEVSIRSFVQAINFDHNLSFTFKQKSSWTDFINRYETPVDIRSAQTLDGAVVTQAPIKQIPLPSQIIKQTFETVQKKALRIGSEYPAIFESPDFQTEFVANDIAQLNLDDDVRNELQTNMAAPLLIRGNEQAQPIFILKYGGNFVWDIKLAITELNTRTADPSLTKWKNAASYEMYIQFNNEVPILFNRVDKSKTFITPPGIVAPFEQTDEWSEFDSSGNRFCEPGDEIKLWMKFLGPGTLGYGNNGITIAVFQPYILGSDDNNIPMQPALAALYPGDYLYTATPYVWYRPFVSGPENPIESKITFIQYTEYPATTAEGFFIHDVAKAVAERYGCKFTSPYLGNDQTTPAYLTNGCGNNFMLVKGLHLRGFTVAEKAFFHSMKDIFNGFGNIMPVGLKETVNAGETYLEILPIEDLYPNVEPVVNLYNVKNIKRSYKDELFYNKVISGYHQGGNSATGGLDDSHYDITRASILKAIGVEFDMRSEYLASSLLFEQARRMSENRTDDYDFDNNTFIVSVHKDEDVYTPELDENFDDITGVVNPSRYNYRITPARNFIRRLKLLSVGLFQYVGSLWKFTEGKGNYDLSTTMVASACDEQVGVPVSEKQDIQSVKPLFIGNAYEIEHYITETQWKLLQENRHVPIGISQTSRDAKPFYIFDFQYSEFEGTIKMIACPKDFFKIDGNLGNIPSADDNEAFDDTFDYTYDINFD